MDHRRIYALIALYIVMVSTIPLIGGLIALREWVGFDTGAYYYRNRLLEVRVTGLPEALGKPRIYVYMPNSSYRPVLLIELDDRDSSIESLSLFYDPRDIRIASFNETLIITYVFDSFNLSKRIVACNDSIKIIFESTRNAHLYMVFKGKNYTYVNGVEIDTIRGKSVKFNNITELNFQFNNRFTGDGGGSLTFSNPVDVEASESLEGVTSINVEFIGERLEMEVRGYTSSVIVSSVTHTLSNLLNHRTVQLLLPVASIAAVAIGWIIWRRL